ncbi:MAG: hypothetical protein IH991_00475 [Planctomycetes bacterium]|nr:hypothetical protein [Planctomycetota bacterium]
MIRASTFWMIAFAVCQWSSLVSTSVAGQVKPSRFADASVDALIRELGGAVFAEREAAADELARRGDKATDALESTLDNPDLEIRLRAQQVLARIAKANLETRLTAFVDDIEGKQEHDLPAWRSFEKQMGSGREMRELFAGMVRVEAAFLEMLDDKSADLSSDYNLRVRSLQANAIPGLERTVSPASLATLLFVGNDPRVILNTSVGYQLYSLLSRTSSADAIANGPQSAAMKKLLANWLIRSSTNAPLARNGLMLAQRYKMNDVGLQLARSLLSQKNVPTYVLPYAILAVGQFGEKKDGALIEPLLANTTVCHSWHNPKFKEVIRIQVRDVALATVIHLQGKDPKEFGFDLLRKDPNSLFYVYTLGFPAEKQRDAALAKWKEHRRKATANRS